MYYYLKALRNWSFQGRARRKEYFLFYLFSTLAYFLGSLADGVLGTYDFESGIGLVSSLLMLVHFFPGVAVLVRRLHDRGLSGWWALVSFVPLLGLLILIPLVMEGEPEDNQYGANPKGGWKARVAASAREWREAGADESSGGLSLLQNLTQLGDLKERGIISEAEFARLKSDLVLSAQPQDQQA